MPTPKFTNVIIEAAIDGLEAKKHRIDVQIAELRAMLTGTPETPVVAPTTGKARRKFSAAARRRMKEAQQRRWAKVKGESAAPVAAPKPSKAKRRLSAEGRANIIAAIKRRFAAKKKAAEAQPVKRAGRKKAA